MKKDENTLMVLPLNTDKIIAAIEQLIGKPENTEYKISQDAICEDMAVLDNECCYGYLENRVFNGAVMPVYDIGVRIVTITPEGKSFPMSNSFYFTQSLSQLKELFCKEPVSLKEFMGQRYDYNPRIKANMRNFLEDINTLINQ